MARLICDKLVGRKKANSVYIILVPVGKRAFVRESVGSEANAADLGIASGLDATAGG